MSDLEIAENTLIVFLSDNGPEAGAGSAGEFKGRKRSLLEGLCTMLLIMIAL